MFKFSLPKRNLGLAPLKLHMALGIKSHKVKIEFRRFSTNPDEPKRPKLFSLRNFGRLLQGAALVTIGYAGYSMYTLKNPPKHQLPFSASLPTLVLLGSGWGTTAILQNLDTQNWNVVVISPRNYFLFTPLLPSCTVGTLELRSLMMPLRAVTGYKKRHVQFIEAETIDIDPEDKVTPSFSQTNL
jgi:NADH:ubiquinone reductase (non-electrogenic)